MTLLNKSDINLQELFESSPTGVIYLDGNGKIIAANPAAEEILGMQFKEMELLTDFSLGWKFIDIDENVLPKEKLPPNIAISTGRPVRNVIIGFYPSTSGESKWIKIDAIPQFKNSDTTPNQIYISCLDVTQQKNIEEKLSQSELKYKALVNNMYSSMIIIQDAEVKFANKALEELSGYNLQEILGGNFLDYVAPEEKEKVLRFYKNRLEGKNIPNEYRTRVVKKSGQTIFVNIKVKTIQFGNEPAILVIMTDIDDHVKSEIKLKDSEEKFKSIVQSINDGIVYINDDAKILHFNNALLDLLGINENNNILGENVIELAKTFAKKNKLPLFNKFIAQCLKGTRVAPIEIEYDSKILEFNSSFDTNSKRVVLVVRDLTLQKQTEHELLIQSRRAGDALRGTNLGTWEWNIKTGKMAFNERCTEIIGYSLVDASGWNMQKWKERAHPYDLKKSEKLMEAHFHHKSKYYECELRLKHKNGNWIWVMEKGKVAIWSNEGEPLLISGTQQDITDRKMAEQEIKESQRILATLMDNLPGMAYRCKNEKDWPMEFISNGCFELTGYRPSELIGPNNIPYAELIHPDDRDFVFSEVQKALDKNAPFEIEYRILTADGKEKFVWEKGVGVFNKGKILFIEGFIHDITADKIAENALRNQELLLRQVAENYPNSFVLIVDSDLHVILSAGQEYKNQKLQPVNHRGKLPEEIFGEKAEMIKEYYQRTLHGEECDFELLISNNYMHFRTVPIKTESEAIKRILVVIENVSEKKQLWNDLVTAKEKAEESDKLKSAFLTTMNHELRTPLNHVIGFSEIIRDTSNENNIKKFAQTIFQSGLGLLGMIEDIFDLALSEKSVIKVRLNSFKVETMYLEMKSFLDEFHLNSGKQDKIDLVFNPEKELLSKEIVSDKNKLVQVMINLFKNAIKFTENGTIEFGMYETENTHINLYVKDTGIGIADDKKDVIFEFFRQGDDSHTRKFGGVGIGLAISKKIAEAMKGSIVVHSEPGKGAMFLFTVPLTKL